MKPNNKILDQLFQQLQSARSESRIEAILTQIWNIWLNSGDIETNKLIRVGTEELSANKYSEAINTFTQVVEKHPNFAEGWNKRATAYYLRGNFKQAIEDIDRVLELEERHFGALAGLATIYSEIGDDFQVLKTLEKLYDIHPYQSKLKDKITELRKKLYGN